MNKRYMILPLLLVLLASSLSLGQTADNNSIVGNNTGIVEDTIPNLIPPLNESNLVDVTESALVDATESALVDATMNATVNEIAPADNVTITSPVPNLNYIWSFSGIEASPITMVLEETDSVLIGRAKYEPDNGMAWNADVIGSVVLDKVDITMGALKDNALTMTRLSGIFANEAISGNFIQMSEGKIVNNGTFNAIWINPDTTSYVPAAVEKPVAALTPAVTEVINTTAATAVDETVSKKKYVDVREYKDKIGMGGDLSGIPPGMSGL